MYIRNLIIAVVIIVILLIVFYNIKNKQEQEQSMSYISDGSIFTINEDDAFDSSSLIPQKQQNDYFDDVQECANPQLFNQDRIVGQNSISPNRKLARICANGRRQVPIKKVPMMWNNNASADEQTEGVDVGI